MLFVTGASDAIEPINLNLRCPSCLHNGAFHGFERIYDLYWSNDEFDPDTHDVVTYQAGIRRCPNLKCQAIVSVFLDTQGNERVYPPEVIDFDATNLPANILESLEEAVKCHAAECYRASALMVRRVLEELCDDKGAAGPNLKERISALNNVAVIPGELLNAADELRILGNDAAHIRAKDYDAIGEEESELAIELAKELLKAVYQYASLVARLQALKRPPV